MSEAGATGPGSTGVAGVRTAGGIEDGGRMSGAEYDPTRASYKAAQQRRDRAVDIAAGTNGYDRLAELVGIENFAEFHACICGIAYAIADRIDASEADARLAQTTGGQE
jgi:hypothetical protein